MNQLTSLLDLFKSGSPYGAGRGGRQGPARGGYQNGGGRNFHNNVAPPAKRELILPNNPDHWINLRGDRESAYQRGKRDIPEEKDRYVTSKPPICWFHPGNPVMFETVSIHLHNFWF